MRQTAHSDIIGGAILVLVGVSAAFYAGVRLSIGSLSQMGPGMFPVAVGVIIAGLGVVILISGFFRSGEVLEFSLVPFIAIIASVLAFVFTVRPFGLVPSVMLTVAIASRADGKLSPLATLSLAGALAALVVAVFHFALRIPVPIASWPW